VGGRYVFSESRFTCAPAVASDFRAIDGITGIVQPLATLPSISKVYFTHSQHASGQSLTT
jgi:hypothetical protein